MRLHVRVAILAVILVGAVAPMGVDAATLVPSALRVAGPQASSSGVVRPHPVNVRDLSNLGRGPRAQAADDIQVESSFAGLNIDDGGGSAPPDVQIAAGPSAVVEFVNVTGRIWTKAGVTTRTFDLGSFFGTGSDDTSDPRILYDAPSGRWFASLLNVTRSQVQLAVSMGGDPAGQWSQYLIPAQPNTCPDQPKLGIGNASLVVTADFFDTSCLAKAGGAAASKVWVVDKAMLVAGQPISPTSFGPTDGLFGIIAGQDLTSSDTVYVAAADFSASSDNLSVYELTGPPVVGMAMPVHNLTIPALAFQSRGNQPGPVDLEAAVGKIDDAAFQNGLLSLVMDDVCTPTGDTAKHACARVVSISTTSWTVVSQAELSRSGQDIAYPALRPDSNGNLDIVYGFSSEQIYPSLAVAALRTDGTWSSSSPVLATGTAAVNDEGDAKPGGDPARYGDYFGAAVDPSDPGLIWVAGEIGKTSSGGGDWATVVGSVRSAPGPSLAVSASAAAIPWGTGVTLSIHLAPDSGGGTGAGRPVHLQSSVDHTTWGTIADLTTDASGDARFVYRPVTNLYYRAVFDGAADYPAVTSSETRVTVRQILLLRPDNARRTKQIAAGSTVAFTALVRPARSDVPPGTVTFQLWENTGSWRLITSRTVKPDATGRARFAATFADPASYYVRAIANPTPVNANSAWSPLERYDAF